MYTVEQITQIVAVACEKPEDSQRPISQWTSREIADEANKRGFVEKISSGTVCRVLKEADLQPHRCRYWLFTKEKDPVVFAAESKVICNLYLATPKLAEQGFHVISVDEKTSIQALERIHPNRPMRPTMPELIETEYKRHGTQCLIASFDVATGKVFGTVGPTRTEDDFAAHIARNIETDPEAPWIFVADQLNTHKSESLVRLVAQECGIPDELGKKGKKSKEGEENILENMESRAKFLSDPTHRIRFVYTPKHSSWMNQVEIWFSILVRKLLKRAGFDSVEQLKDRILEFIEYFNKTMAKAFKWTYKGKVLQAS